MKLKRYVLTVGMTGSIKKKCKSHGPQYKILRHTLIIQMIQRLFRCKELSML